MRFFTRKLGHPIRRGDFVIDVGSGGDPHPRSNVIVDRSIIGGDRTKPFVKHADAVVADIAALPFRDGSFDFSICSHLMEHLSDPEGAARELGRVSSRGYIETPSEIHERLFPIGWHKWFVRKTADGLGFEAKPSLYLDETLGAYFRPLWGSDRRFMSWLWSRRDDFFIRYYWAGTPNIVVEGLVADCFNTEEEVHHPMGAGEGRKGLKFWIYKGLCMIRYRSA